MSDIVPQASFNSGEWAPALFARVDMQKYRSGAALLQNFFVDYRGGASSRPGTQYLLQCLNPNFPVRLIPFQVTSTLGFVLEFGQHYIRFYQNGSAIVETGIAITGATQANPCVLTIPGNPYSAGDWIFITGVAGMTQLNGRYFNISNVTGAAVTITDLRGTPIDSTAYTAYSSGGTAARVYTITSPYAGNDLALVKFAQNINQMILCHPSYAPQILTETSPASWTIAPITFGSTIGAPTITSSATNLAAGSVNYGYLATAIDANGQESAAGPVFNLGPLQDLRTTAGSITLVIGTPVAGAIAYNFYKTNVSYTSVVSASAIYGFIGQTGATSFVDSNISPDYTQTPPRFGNPFAFGNPGVPTFFQQRLIFGNLAPALPQSFFGSRTGNYFNFNSSSPPKATDAVSATLVSSTLNTIKSIVSATTGMLILTDRASWLINGGLAGGSALTPSSIVANTQSFNGANDVPPIVANYDVLYVQEKGASVRDLSYNIYFNVFTGTDISIIASHLFFGYQILEWAWAEEPFKVVWAIRSDGIMLTLTFLKEQEFVGWAHQTTNGVFKSVCTVTEADGLGGFRDAVYTVVARQVGGNFYPYVERVVNRIFPNGLVDAWCVDAALQYVGSPTTSFTGAEHLAGFTVTGLADGVIIPPFVMPNNGFFTLGVAASKVTIGLAYTCQLQTLALDMGEPSVQGKVKKIPHVDVRVNQTLGLTIGPDFNNQVVMKDLVQGAVGSMLTGQSVQVVSGLFTGDARTFLPSAYTVPGQYCIQQSNPYPASILGVFPAVVVGDDK